MWGWWVLLCRLIQSPYSKPCWWCWFFFFVDRFYNYSPLWKCYQPSSFHKPVKSALSKIKLPTLKVNFFQKNIYQKKKAISFTNLILLFFMNFFFFFVKVIFIFQWFLLGVYIINNSSNFKNNWPWFSDVMHGLNLGNFYACFLWNFYTTASKNMKRDWLQKIWGMWK